MIGNEIKTANMMGGLYGNSGNEGKRIYTVDEIQDILGISRPTAYKLIHRGEFRSVRAGGHIKVSKVSFDAWLDAQMA